MAPDPKLTAAEREQLHLKGDIKFMCVPPRSVRRARAARAPRAELLFVIRRPQIISSEFTTSPAIPHKTMPIFLESLLNCLRICLTELNIRAKEDLLEYLLKIRLKTWRASAQNLIYLQQKWLNGLQILCLMLNNGDNDSRKMTHRSQNAQIGSEHFWCLCNRLCVWAQRVAWLESICFSLLGIISL